MLVKAVFFLLCSVMGYAQVPKLLEGNLVDSQRRGISGIKVQWAGSDLPTTTDTQGYFRLELPFDTVSGTLLLTHPEYKNQQLPIVLGTEGLNLGAWQMRYAIDRQDEELLDNDTFVQDDEGFDTQFGRFLAAQRDPFLQAVAFSFSAAFFRPRGLDPAQQQLLINGLTTHDFETGRPQWAPWGGLNDFTNAGRQSFYGIQANSSAFGGVLGTNEIRLRPSEFRPGNKLSVAFSNASYQQRLMFSQVGQNTGAVQYGLLVSRRSGIEGYQRGTHYHSVGLAGLFEVFWSPSFSTHIALLYSPTLRGQSAPMTEEVFALKGRKYNPYWGNDGKRQRNPRQVRTELPQLYLSHRWEPKTTSLWELNLRYQKGRRGRGRLFYNGVAPQETYFLGGGANPSPVYYQKLPSYYLRDPQNPDFEAAYGAEKQLQTKGQFDWAELYRANSLQDWAIYATYEDRIQTQQGDFSFLHKARWTPWLSFQCRVASTLGDYTYFASPTDLLGAQYLWNIDAYAPTYETGFFDLENKDQPIQIDSPFQYHYRMDITQHNGSIQWVLDTKHWEIFTGGQFQKTSYLRTGYFTNGAFPNSSFGEGKPLAWNTYGLKGGIQYRLSGRHSLAIRSMYLETPPALRNSFVQPRLRNKHIPEQTAAVHTAHSIQYRWVSPRVFFDLRAFQAQTTKSTQSQFYFADGIGGDEALFVQAIMTDLGQRHRGAELGARFQLSDVLALNAAANWGEYRYTHRPNLWLASTPGTAPILPQNEEGMLALGPAFIKGYKVPSGPQQAYHMGLDYADPNYWRLGISANYFAANPLAISPLSRTKNFYQDFDGQPFADYDPEKAKEMLAQETLPPAFLVHVNFNKSWRVGNDYFGVFISVQNLLNRIYKTGGFEQSRNANYRSMLEDRERLQPLFAPKYWWGRGTTFFSSLYYRF